MRLANGLCGLCCNLLPLHYPLIGRGFRYTLPETKCPLVNCMADWIIPGRVIMEPCLHVSLGISASLFNYLFTLLTLSGTCWSLSNMLGIFIGSLLVQLAKLVTVANSKMEIVISFCEKCPDKSCCGLLHTLHHCYQYNSLLWMNELKFWYFWPKFWPVICVTDRSTNLANMVQWPSLEYNVICI